MRGDTLSVFIEANRFPPAINEHRYSILRAESDAVAERMLTIANNNKNNSSRASYAISDMNRLSGNSIYELEANEISVIEQCPSQTLELPVLPRISVMSAFNPFDEQLSSPPSPVPDQLKPATEADTLPTTPLTCRPPTNYLPFIAPTTPFDPYKEKYEPHPAGPYGAKKFKNRQTMSSAPFGYERPVTPTFSDTTSSFLRFSDTSPPTASDQAVAGSSCSSSSSSSTSQNSCSPPRTPLFRPFKIPRKPLPPGAKQFPPVSYTPPGSPVRHDSPQNTGAETTVGNPVSQHPRRALTDSARIRSIPKNQTARRKPGPNVHKPLPPSPARPANTSHRQRPASSSNPQRRRVSKPSDHGMQVLYPRSPEYIPRPVTAADRVRSELKNVKERALDRLFKLRRG